MVLGWTRFDSTMKREMSRKDDILNFVWMRDFANTIFSVKLSVTERYVLSFQNILYS